MHACLRSLFEGGGQRFYGFLVIKDKMVCQVSFVGKPTLQLAEPLEEAAATPAGYDGDRASGVAGASVGVAGASIVVAGASIVVAGASIKVTGASIGVTGSSIGVLHTPERETLPAQRGSAD